MQTKPLTAPNGPHRLAQSRRHRLRTGIPGGSTRLAASVIGLLLTACVWSSTLRAESFSYATLVYDDVLTVPAGKTALVVFVASAAATESLTYTRQGKAEVRIAFGQTSSGRGGWDSSSAGNPNADSTNPMPLVGPATLRADRVNAVFGLKLVDTQQPSPSTATPNGTPSTAVVIPEDATGPVEIVLESTADLVNWVPANPGTYGNSTPNRFFRVRAIQKPAN